MQPETGYALLGDQRIAYQLIGDGPVDLLIAPSWFSAFDIEWEEPSIRRFLEELAAFARVIRLDRRGSGASDRLGPDSLPVWEGFAEDIRCVMDEVGSESAVIYADGDAGPLGLLFAATHPERVRGLVLFNTSARFLADEDYPIGLSAEMADQFTDVLSEDWGTGEQLTFYVPSRADDPEFRRWMGRLMRAVTTPSSVRRYMDGVIVSDARTVLESIEAPTLILHARASEVPTFEHARYLADHIPGSSLVELSGPGDAFPFFALAEQVLPAVQGFITGSPVPAPTERTMATVLFTDIVDSTSRAGQLGDHQWRRLLDLHDDAVRRDVSVHSGQLIKNTGDGILATFDGPGRAVRFATGLQGDLADISLTIRTGIHTGEVERRGADIGGLAVHLGARIMAAAEPGEILVSRTVKDLVIGSQIRFRDRGVHALKGIEGEWQLFAVVAG